jgi:hypothetical protein
MLLEWKHVVAALSVRPYFSCQGHNSETTRDISKKQLLCVQNLFGEHHPVRPAVVFLFQHQMGVDKYTN